MMARRSPLLHLPPALTMPRRTSRRSPPPDVGSTWEADLSPVAIAFDDDPAARPTLLLVVADGFILAGDLVAHPGALPAQIAETLAVGIQSATTSAGQPPKVVQVRHRTVAEKLGELLVPSGVTVRCVADLPGVDAALAGFAEIVLGLPADAGPLARVAHPETWAGWGLSMEQIGRFFSAAAAYFRAAPWSNITNEDILRAEVRGGGKWSASVMGMAGELFGLALYERHEDLLALLGADPGRPLDAMRTMKGSVITLSYDRRDEVPKAMQKEVRKARWEIAGPSAYPTIMAMNTPGGGITARMMEDVIAMLDNIPAFAAKQEPMLSGRKAARYPIRWRSADGSVSIVFDGAPDRLG